jgi:sugar phosphate permease
MLINKQVFYLSLLYLFIYEFITWILKLINPYLTKRKIQTEHKINKGKSIVEKISMFFQFIIGWVQHQLYWYVQRLFCLRLNFLPHLVLYKMNM